MPSAARPALVTLSSAGRHPAPATVWEQHRARRMKARPNRLAGACHRMLDLARKSMIAGFAPGEENPLHCQTLASLLPLVKTTSAGPLPSSAAISARAASTGARAESPPSGRSTDSLGIAKKRPHGVGHVRVDRRAGIVVEVHSAWHRAKAARNDSNAPLLGVGAFSHGLRGGYCPPAVI